mgnify:CR=1 FL=1
MIKKIFAISGIIFILSGCSFFKRKGDVHDLAKIQEFDKVLEIKEVPEAKPPPGLSPKPMPKPRLKVVPKKAITAAAKVLKREPEIEDSVGFVGRRPLKDPFRVGEKSVLSIGYLGVTAGDLTLEVGNFLEVNNQKAYNFLLSVKSNPTFSFMYEVNDLARTFVSFDTLLPLGFSLQIRETRDLKESRNVFDWKSLKSNTWTKFISDGKVKEEKQEGSLLSFSQNVYSVIYYLRNFDLTVGKSLVFRVSDKGQNLLFKGNVLRKEKLTTAVGDFDTVVVKPEFEMDGIFKPVGDIFLWLTDDDRKFIVKIESKIKIGTLVGELKELQLGQN